MGQAKVGVLMGSDSDWPTMQETAKTLRDFGIPFEVEVVSAHRSPARAHEYAASAEERGLEVIIAAAGGAAHLAGVIAAWTTLPVIGVPMKTETVGGEDSLWSMVQMPAGIPVATVAIGKAGAINAAVLAAEILALRDPELRAKLKKYRERLAERVAEKSQKVQEALGEIL